MSNVFKDLLLSKKFVVAVLSVAGAVAAYKGWNLDTTQILVLVSPFLILIGAQGWTDAGKEAAQINQDTQLKIHAMIMQNEKDKMTPTVDRFLKSNQAGFAKLAALVATLVLAAGASVFMVVACAHPGQATLKTSECVLDSSVLSRVLSDLEQSNYKQLVDDLALQVAPELVDCALLAVASQQPGAGSESGSAQLPSAARVAPAVDLSARAREVLDARRAAKH